ncbi:calcineurin subunit B type 1 [Eupeodes corollae]|uniref:calcineurin subunit B type 1 n=1 Tax=Eupeodes corollae TaxID=290404 RepID=UPI00249399BD|nr:calcineurin subunit B type 1 [Eupeodes corollae]
MGNKSSSSVAVPKDDLIAITNSTKFTLGEIEYLYTRFCALGAPQRRTGFLVKRDFNFPSYALHSLILTEMFGNKYDITFVEFAKFLHTFRPLDFKASKEERAAMKTRKLKLLFSMYDINKDGSISKEDLLDVVHRLCSDYTDIHTMIKIVQLVIKEMDSTKTNRILFDDFCKSMEIFDMDNLAVKFPTL